MSLLPTEPTKPKTALSDFNWIIYGAPGIGKTTLANDFPGALFLATEDGQGAHGCYRVAVDSWEKFLGACRELAQGKHSFATIIVDTVDNLWSLCATYVCAKRGIEHESELEWGKGFELVRTEFFRALTKLSFLPHGLVMISHAQDTDVETRTRKFTKTVPSFKLREQPRLLGMVDFIFYCDHDATKDATGKPTYQRVIRTKAAEAYVAKDRTGRLPDPMPLGFDHLSKAFDEAVKTKTNKGSK